MISHTYGAEFDTTSDVITSSDTTPGLVATDDMVLSQSFTGGGPKYN